MGVQNCCSIKNNNENNKEVIFDNQRILVTSQKFIDNIDGKEYIYNNNERSLFFKIKEDFEALVKYQGNFTVNQNIKEIIEKRNPYGNELSFPEEIENTLYPDCFISPPIKFHSGEIYQGSWNKDKQKHGYGIDINPNGLVYKGLWDKDRVGDKGIFIDLKGNYYKGDLLNGKYEGEGELFLKDKFKYTGIFKDNFPNGKGTLIYFEKNIKYSGEIIEGKKHGKGILEFADGTIYEGDFSNDFIEGKGIIRFSNGNIFEGLFKEGKIQGKGKFIWSDGKIYDGEYEDFLKKGYGKFFWNEDKYYEGQWLNNKQHGKGVIHYNGKEVKGTFRFGKIIKEG